MARDAYLSSVRRFFKNPSNAALNRADVNIPFFASRGIISISRIVVERDSGIEGLPRMNMFSKSAIINHALSGGTMLPLMEGFVAK